ncbi:hypothetical protein ACFRAQ_36085 [Nocardia sp. NPDC056611]|uniref:hypothetical protein n=1 Tax=Nocardia sp. NPDC056611 TaxID=3345877 RepID=UPI0036712088
MSAGTRWWDHAGEIPVGVRFRQGGSLSVVTFRRAGEDCVIDEHPSDPALYTPAEVDRFWRNEHGWVEARDAA